MRRDRRRQGGRHAIPREAPDSSPAGTPPGDQPTQAGAPHPGRPNHADLFTPAGEPSHGVGHDAFEVLADQHRDALLGYVLRLTRGDEPLAEDIVKETLYRASQDTGRLTQRPSAVRPRLVLLARTVFQDGQRWQTAEAPQGPATPVATTVARALANLSRVHRDILVELFYRGTSLQDAALAWGVPVETVKSRLYYAMRALRVVLDQQASEHPEQQ